MPEAILGQVAGAAVGGLLGGQDQQQTQTASKEPWAAAVPWLTNNLTLGQNLQSQYMANPFNAGQTTAFNNMSNTSNNAKRLVSDALGTLNNQAYFDRSNPNARPAQFQFNTGNLGLGGGYAAQQPISAGSSSPQVTAQAPAAAPAASEYYQNDMGEGNGAWWFKNNELGQPIMLDRVGNRGPWDGV